MRMSGTASLLFSPFIDNFRNGKETKMKLQSPNDTINSKRWMKKNRKKPHQNQHLNGDERIDLPISINEYQFYESNQVNFDVDSAELGNPN